MPMSHGESPIRRVPSHMPYLLGWLVDKRRDVAVTCGRASGEACSRLWRYGDVTSHRLKRGKRGAVAAAAVLAAVGSSSGSAGAQPAGDPVKQYEELSQQAEKLNDDVLKAQENLDAKTAELTKAGADLNQAKQAEE